MVFFAVALTILHCVELQGIFVPDRNPGDRYFRFVFALPELYRNATVGPDVWQWLADRYGAAHLTRGGVRLARILCSS